MLGLIEIKPELQDAIYHKIIKHLYTHTCKHKYTCIIRQYKEAYIQIPAIVYCLQSRNVYLCAHCQAGVT